MVRTSNIFDKATQLITQSSENFIFVLHRLCEGVSTSQCEVMQVYAHRPRRESTHRECAPDPMRGRWWRVYE